MAPPQAPTLRLVTFAAGLALLYAFRSVLWPLALAFVLAILIGVVSARVTRLLPRAGHRTVRLVTAAIIGSLVLATMSIVVAGVAQILGQAPAVYRRIDDIVGGVQLPGLGRYSLDELNRHVDAGALAAVVVSNVQSAAGGLSLTAIYLVFITLGNRQIARRIEKIVASSSTDAVVRVIERSVRSVETYTYIQTITGLMIAVASLLVMWAVGLDNALFWALALFFLSYLPIVGVMLGSIAPTLFALVQFSTPVEALIVFLGIQAIAFIVGNFVLPKMQADSQNIDPTASLVAIGVWTILWGIPGAFLAIPLTLAIMYSLAQYRSVEWIAVLISNDGSPIPAEINGGGVKA